ncbi:MAG: transporter substrate-binding domain-containing protein [Verrucomicrobiaceae bacterium]|nr:MAG: transporter substrate-binding domain-containing protein [Verrucomicrobiaceae bacterium]
MNRRHALALLSAAAAPLAACSPKKDNSLVVGMDMTYPPFEFKNEKGEPDGVDVRMAEDLAKYLGRPLKLESYAFEGLIPALQAEKIDLIISGMTQNETRKKSIDFSDPYAFTALAMLVAKDSSIQSIDDVKKPGSRIAAKIGTTGESWARANLPEAKVTALESEAICALEVAQGRADAFLYDQLSIFRYYKSNPSTTRAILKPFVEESWSIGIRQGNEELKSKVNAFLKHYRESGAFAKLGDTYLTEERKLLEEMGQPFILR